MTAQPVCLDLFCGAGGAGMGYKRAGFDLLGVDRSAQPDYPGRFELADWRDGLARYGEVADFIHASPPCQGYTTGGKRAARRYGTGYEFLIPEVQAALYASGKPYVLENVMGSSLATSVVLCGEMFGLRVIRHRKFECSFVAFQPAHRKHRGPAANGNACLQRGEFHYFCVAGNAIGSRAEWASAMGVDWITTKHGVRESIPPAYTEYLGRQVLPIVKRLREVQS